MKHVPTMGTTATVARTRAALRPAPTPADDPAYDRMLRAIAKKFSTLDPKVPLFTTDTVGLFDLYIAKLPVDQRQYHNCNTCRRFIERFGGLVTISPDGVTKPAVLAIDAATGMYASPMAAMYQRVKNATVTGVFLSTEKEWGTPVTEPWKHFAVKPPKELIFKNAIWSAGQKMAEKLEDFKNMNTALQEFTTDVLKQAVTLLKTDALYRSEKTLGQAEWMLRLNENMDSTFGPKTFANRLWLAVATAPPGFCHPRSSMIGTLLEDLAAGKPFEDVAAAFKAKMHPTVYQRPQAAPAAGTIKQAEEIFQKMNAAPALLRRFCRIDEIPKFWQPSPPGCVADPSGTGVFGHIKPKGAATPVESVSQGPIQNCTWEKFRRVVMPTANRIELHVPSHGFFTALVTAVDPDAVPIIQWDNPKQRNPVSWYIWTGGNPATQFGLRGGTFVEVEAMTERPCHWNGSFTQFGPGAILVLKGAKETKIFGNALFPEILKADLHGVRSVIEAYSKGAKIDGIKDSHVAGLMLSKEDTQGTLLRVTTNIGCSTYRIDRWD